MFTQEEIARAKETSMTQLVQYLGYKPVRIGKCYTLKEMDSVRIYQDKSWYRWSDRTGGTPIDFLMKFGKYDFRQAVELLLNLQGVIPEQKREDRKERQERKMFLLPSKAENFKRMFAYLIKTRGLSAEVVEYFVKKKLLYEDREHHNCVFVGYDREGIPRHATCRGTATGVRFVGDVEGNDKNYVLHIISPMSDEIKVFESAIDCMSYMDLSGDYTSNKQVLGMTADNPLNQTLKDYPNIRKISFCLDWDNAGRKATEQLMEKYRSLGYRVRNLSSIHERYLGKAEGETKQFSGKDWNELLVYNRARAEERMMQQEAREQENMMQPETRVQERSR